MSVRPPRIIGSEVEYGLAVWIKGKQAVTFFSNQDRHTMFYKFLPEPLVMAENIATGDSGGYLSNGARFYLDTGFHPEYASPEALFATDLVAYEKSGDLIVTEVVRRANEEWGNENIHLRAFKNNVAPRDPEDNPHVSELEAKKEALEKTYGNHQNFLMARRNDLTPEKLIVPLGLFLATCQLFTGSGRFWRDEKGTIRFRISQRSPHIIHSYSGSTTSDRALINTRDEPLAYPNQRRLHLIASDSNLSEVPIFLKFAVTGLLLDMVEAGWAEQMLTRGGAYPYWNLLQEFSNDSSLTMTETISGRPYSIVDIQEECHTAAQRFCAQMPTDNPAIEKERGLLLKLWGKIIDRARDPRPHEALSSLVDWATKKFIAEQDVEKRSLSLRSAPDLSIARKSGSAQEKKSRRGNSVTLIEHLLDIDRQYHALDPRGIWNKLNGQGYFERVVSDEEIALRVFEPVPKSTRACARAEEVRYARAHAKELGCPGWIRPVLKWEPFPTVNPYLDPYDWKPKHPLLTKSG